MSTQQRVFLGVGHGYDAKTGRGDPGAVGVNGIKEADLNLLVALACRDELRRHNIIVGMSREKQEMDPIGEEVRECNAFDPNLAVDIHFNSASGSNGDGCEFLVFNKGGKSLELGLRLEKRMVAAGQQTRGCKSRLNAQGQDYFAFIRDVRCPSVIAEMAFVNNVKDITDFDEKQEQKKWGEILAHGILDMLGVAILNKNETSESKPVVDNNHSNRTVSISETKVMIDNKPMQGGFIVDGRTYLPARALCELVGVSIDFKDQVVYINTK